jgi:hypothetical protein
MLPIERCGGNRWFRRLDFLRVLSLVMALTIGIAAAPPSLAEGAPTASAAKDTAAAPVGSVTIPLSEYQKLTGAAGKSDDSWGKALLGFVVALAWPLTALLLAWRISAMQGVQIALNKIVQGISQLKVAGFEIELNAAAAATLEDVEKLLSQVPETHRDWVANSHIRTQFQLVFEDIKRYLRTDNPNFTPIAEDDFGQLRFTLHVPDVLVTNSLRQLVGYLGCDRGGAGRVFSSRTGIIGQAWRLMESKHVPNNTFGVPDLITQWGMTYAEASCTKGGKVLHMAIIIKSTNGVPLGVLYGDSAKTDSTLFDSARRKGDPAMDIWSELERHIRDACSNRELTASLEELEKTRVKVRQIDFYATRIGSNE